MAVDCIKTRSDVRGYIGDMISDEYKNGCFRSEPVATFNAAVHLNCLLSGHLFPAHCLGGINENIAAPKWNAYKDNLTQFNIIAGPAGSGKTMRHFMDYGNPDPEKDFRLDTTKVAYMTLTNHLSIYMAKKLGVTAYTSYKGMNRRVDDESRIIAPGKRYNKTAHFRDLGEVDKLKGKHTIFLDEVTMQEPEKLLDTLRVCREYGLQILITGDIAPDGTLYQLGPVVGSGEALFKALHTAEQELGIVFNWVTPMELFRQSEDRQLGDFLTSLREERDPLVAWRSLLGNSMFEHIELPEMMRRFDLCKDAAVSPMHNYLKRVTGELMTHRVQADTLIPVRCNVQKPMKVEQATPFMMGFVPMDASGNPDSSYELITKGMTRFCTRQELNTEGAAFMKADRLYDKANDINPMLGVTVHNLQGLTIADDATLYLVYHGDGDEWHSFMDPRCVYVASSRVRRRQQLVIVHLPVLPGERGGKRARVYF